MKLEIKAAAGANHSDVVCAVGWSTDGELWSARCVIVVPKPAQIITAACYQLPRMAFSSPTPAGMVSAQTALLSIQNVTLLVVHLSQHTLDVVSSSGRLVTYDAKLCSDDHAINKYSPDTSGVAEQVRKIFIDRLCLIALCKTIYPFNNRHTPYAVVCGCGWVWVGVVVCMFAAATHVALLVPPVC
jgi:hypothetical protein